MSRHARIRTYSLVPQTWGGRLFIAIVTLAALFLAMFFFTLFLIAIMTLTAVLILRAIWTGGKVERNTGEDFIEGEYTAESDAETEELDRERRRIDTTYKS